MVPQFKKDKPIADFFAPKSQLRRIKIHLESSQWLVRGPLEGKTVQVPEEVSTKRGNQMDDKNQELKMFQYIHANPTLKKINRKIYSSSLLDRNHTPGNIVFSVACPIIKTHTKEEGHEFWAIKGKESFEQSLHDGIPLEKVNKKDGLEPFRKRILKSIKLRLKNHLFFSLRELGIDNFSGSLKLKDEKISTGKEYANYSIGTGFEPQGASSPKRSNNGAEFKLIGLLQDRNGYRLEILSDESSIQKLINFTVTSLRPEELKPLIGFTSAGLKTALNSLSGNELVQEVCQRSPEFRTVVTEYCIKNLSPLIYSESAAKTIFMLAKFEPNFRKKVCNWLTENFSESIEKNSVLYFFISCFKHSKSSIDFNGLLNVMTSTLPGHITENKNFKKLLITYVDICSESELDKIFERLDVKNKMMDWLDDKFLALVLFSFINRRHLETKVLFNNLVARCLFDLVQCRFFKSLFFRLPKLTSDQAYIFEINNSLLSLPDDHYKEICSKEDLFYFFVALIVITSNQQEEVISEMDKYKDDKKKLISVVQSLIQSTKLENKIKAKTTN